MRGLRPQQSNRRTNRWIRIAREDRLEAKRRYLSERNREGVGWKEQSMTERSANGRDGRSEERQRGSNRWGLYTNSAQQARWGLCVTIQSGFDYFLAALSFQKSHLSFITACALFCETSLPFVFFELSRFALSLWLRELLERSVLRFSMTSGMREELGSVHDDSARNKGTHHHSVHTQLQFSIYR